VLSQHFSPPYLFEHNNRNLFQKHFPAVTPDHHLSRLNILITVSADDSFTLIPETDMRNLLSSHTDFMSAPTVHRCIKLLQYWYKNAFPNLYQKCENKPFQNTPKRHPSHLYHKQSTPQHSNEPRRKTPSPICVTPSINLEQTPTSKAKSQKKTHNHTDLENVKRASGRSLWTADEDLALMVSFK